MWVSNLVHGTGRDAGSAVPAAQTVTVYRSPACNCCGAWIQHLRRDGFEVIDRPTHNLSRIKEKYAVPGKMRSCHTSVVDGYAIEGHVPTADIRRLLREGPPVTGLAVPGMPAGSLGMEMGDRRDPYAVFQYTPDGKFEVFQTHGANKP
ncbi:MAG: DUF411 domain-containing protein [Methylothermaceae bacterium]|nr:DUF411 domain-containing protein [Methylothermaceae bacterium]